MSEQEQWIASTFVEIADHLVEEFDVVDLLSTLAERCAQYVSASEVGFMLADPTGALQVVGSTSDKMESLELFELQNSEGPCLDCINTGRAIVNQDVTEVEGRWPAFASVARDAGFRTVHALPMRLRSEVIGVVNLFHLEARTLTENETAITQALADAATIAIVQERALRQATQVAEQLQYALEARVVIEQAKGVLSERLEADMADAFNVMRKYSRNNNRRLSDVAFEVTAGQLSPDVFRPLLEV